MTKQSEPKAIVFDLVGVLFNVNKFKAMKSIGIFKIIWCFIRNRRSPFDFYVHTLNLMRLHVPGEYQEQYTFNGTLLPNTIGLWQRGALTIKQTQLKIKSNFDALEESGHVKTSDKKLLITMANMMIDPAITLAIMQPDRAMIALINNLKTHSSAQIYLLSNIDAETFALLSLHYDSIFSLFDGMVTSYNTGLMKPHAPIFNHLLEIHQLHPHECLFIDDQAENIATAQQLGFDAIHRHKKTNITDEFLKRAIKYF